LEWYTNPPNDPSALKTIRKTVRLKFLKSWLDPWPVINLFVFWNRWNHLLHGWKKRKRNHRRNRIEKSHLNLSWFLKAVTNIEFIEVYLFSQFICHYFTFTWITIENYRRWSHK
jgi:hypothetical protein